MDYNKLAIEIFEQNKAVGWWDDINRCPYTSLQLVSTEIAEATEGERQNIMDDHLPNRKMGEVELADALIRILDFAGRYGIKYSEQSSVTTQGHNPAKWHYFMNRQLFRFGDEITEQISSRDIKTHYRAYDEFINIIEAAGSELGYDIESALYEKLEYNRHRTDHKRESRSKAQGKKF